jgi:phytoene/squalene synthetase
LALYALIHTIQIIPAAHVDDEIIWAKLKWWSEELAAEPDSVSRHPVLRALWTTGARSKIDNVLLQALVQRSIRCIDMSPDADENDMFARLASLGSNSVELEFALDEVAIDKACVEYLGAASGICHILSSFARHNQPEYDRIPLSMLAEFNIKATHLEGHTTEVAQIMTRLAGLGLEWFSQGLACLDEAQKNRAGKHLLLRCAMECRRLKYIKKNAPGFLETGPRYGPADAWFAWRFMRRLN